MASEGTDTTVARFEPGEVDTSIFDTRTRAGLGPALQAGAVIGTIISIVGCTAAMALGGLEEWGSAFGFGVFVAIWGGLGFGTMFGGVMWASKQIEEERHSFLLPTPEP